MGFRNLKALWLGLALVTAVGNPRFKKMAKEEPHFFWLDCLPDDLLNDLDVGVAPGRSEEGGAERSLQHKRFAAPLSEEQIAEARKAAIPKKTQLDTQYCIKVWHEWRNYRNNR